MKTNTVRNSAIGVLTLVSLLAAGGCSQKPASEEVAEQVKAALAEEKAKEQAAAPKPAPRSTPSHASAVPREPAPPPQKPICTECGVVVSIKEIEQAGKGSGLGTIAGGVAGGLVGHQIGQGTGRDLATVAGAIGGAVAGNKIEQNMKKTKSYEVTVRMENGEQRVLRYETAPSVTAGDHVRIEGSNLVRQ